MLSYLRALDTDRKIKWILLLHFFICSFGVVKLSMVAAGNLYEARFLEYAVSQLGLSALQVGVGKLGVFLQYIFGLVFLALFYLMTLWIITRERFFESIFFKNKILLGIYFALNIFLNYRLFLAGSSVAHWIPYWLLFTMIIPLLSFNISWRAIPLLPQWLLVTLAGFILLQLFLIFKPFITQPMLIENDYMDIPGQTWLQSGRWVDNTSYINQHQIGGILKYDPRSDHGENPMPRAGTYIKIDRTPMLQVFLDANNFHSKQHVVYNDKLGVLSVVTEMSRIEHDQLRYAYENPEDKKKIDALYLLSLKLKTDAENRVYTPEEWEFIHKNKMELIDQSKTGWFFYHHNYFFEPIFAMGQGAKDQPLVYGWFTSLFFLKLLPYLGGVNYQSYFKLFFSIYPLYILSFFAVLFVIFRRMQYALLGTVISVATLYAIGLQEILHAPGFNPIRHFLDIFVLASFYLFIQRRKMVWLVISYLLSFLAILFNREFGMFLLASVTAATVINQWRHTRIFSLPVLISVVACAIGAIIYFKWIPGKFNGSVYMLLGEGSPVTQSSLVRNLLLLISSAYLLLILLRNIKDAMNYFWIGVLFYCQLILIYFLWFPQVSHLLAISAPFILLALCAIYLLVRYFKLEQVEANILSGLLMVALIFVYLPNIINFYIDNKEYSNNFKAHRLYQWPFATARLTSTMDPQLFINAVTLINKYEKHPAIYMISKYDTLLPILAEKYVALPYPELLTNLINSNVESQVVGQIEKGKPEYLFVDRDITRNFNTDVYYKYDVASRLFSLNMYSYDRAFVLSRLGHLFDRIKQNYQPIESSELITVYKRIDKNTPVAINNFHHQKNINKKVVLL